MRLLKRQHQPLEMLSMLIWVEEFEFSTSLKLEECYTRLALACDDATGIRADKIIEVLWDGEAVYFAAKMYHRQGRSGTYGELAGRLSMNEVDGKVYAHCYVGQLLSSSLLIFCVPLGLLWTLSSYFLHSNLLWVSILTVAFNAAFLFFDRNIAIDVNAELKYYCRDFLDPSVSTKRYNFKF